MARPPHRRRTGTPRLRCSGIARSGARRVSSGFSWPALLWLTRLGRVGVSRSVAVAFWVRGVSGQNAGDVDDVTGSFASVASDVSGGTARIT
jgi:hypothetical protein